VPPAPSSPAQSSPADAAPGAGQPFADPAPPTVLAPNAAESGEPEDDIIP